MENMWHEKRVDYIAMTLTQLERLKTEIIWSKQASVFTLYSRINFAKKNGHKTHVISSCDHHDIIMWSSWYHQVSNHALLRMTAFVFLCMRAEGKEKKPNTRMSISKWSTCFVFFLNLFYTSKNNDQTRHKHLCKFI